ADAELEARARAARRLPAVDLEDVGEALAADRAARRELEGLRAAGLDLEVAGRRRRLGELRGRRLDHDVPRLLEGAAVRRARAHRDLHRRAAHERRIVGREGEARAARDLLAVDAPLDLEVGRVARRRQRELLRLLEAQTLDAVRRHADLELRLDRRDLPARADLGLTVARGERDLAVAGDRHRELRSVARGLAVDRPGVGDA